VIHHVMEAGVGQMETLDDESLEGMVNGIRLEI
jgi:hypothetical protein